MMKCVLYVVLVVALAAPAAAQYLGNSAPAKSDAPARQTLVRDRQGGDTMADAFLIPGFPFEDIGTTVGYTNDYDEACPYAGSTAPDVVYKLQSTTPTSIAIDMCFSAYDTKIYVYREDFTVVACNDDWHYSDPCGMYTSRIENLELDPAVKYYLVIDGYAEAAGDYVLRVEEYVPCDMPCPDFGVPEGEPPLVDDYVDLWNGGCNTPPDHPFQEFSGWWFEFTLCGRTGWYTGEGENCRDTDWYILHAGDTGSIEITADAEQPTTLYELGPQDCASVDMIQAIQVGPCAETSMTIAFYEPNQPVWIWVGPTGFTAPPGADDEYDYAVFFSGLWLAPTIRTETRTWSSVKSLYR